MCWELVRDTLSASVTILFLLLREKKDSADTEFGQWLANA